jgi:hypothetical protein
MAQAIAWSVSGKGFFITTFPFGLWYMDLKGNGHVLYQPVHWVSEPLPSPDGRRIAFLNMTMQANAWMIEDF